MKKILISAFLAILFLAQKALCATDVVNEEIGKSLKQHNNEPGIFSVLMALAVVIGLIYITGIIYSKLNAVGASTVKKQLKNYDLNKAVVLSTTQLGQGKNLHVIEIDKKRFLIGAAQNSINLLQELAPSSECDFEDVQNEALADMQNENESDVDNDSKESAEFDVYKKYL